MPTVAAIADFLSQIAPLQLAEDWDNVGLLVGRADADVERLMTCLTLSPAVVDEAVEAGVHLIVSHHPFPFHAVKKVTSDTPDGGMLFQLIAANIAVYSAHTAFDSAVEGINQRLAAGLELRGIAPLIPQPDDLSGALGSGRWGRLASPATLADLAARLKKFLAIEHLHMVGQPEQVVHTIAVACGAADEFLDAAIDAHCDAMIIGETRFHTCLKAEASGVSLLLPGHYASERFGVECLADMLASQFPFVRVWPSRNERDPIHWA